MKTTAQVLRLPHPEKKPPTLEDGWCATFWGSGVFEAGGVLLGWLLTWLIERPAHRTLMAFYDRRLVKAPPAPAMR